MSKHLLSNLHERLFGNSPKTKQRTKRRSHRRALAMESLESRHLMSITPLQNLSASENTGEKPQSKVFEYAGQWWTVMPISSGTSVLRLDGTSWTATQQITTAKGFHADVKVVNDLAHVLLFDDGSTKLATLQYDPADNRFEPWALQPQLVNVPLPSSTETATLDVDSTGRMWVAYDVSSTVEVRYSDGLYTNWSSPITVASGINSDDISAIVAMPNNTMGVLWSNQSADRFGFRVHVDGAAATEWSADEVPASQSALNVGGGMADDHLNVAVASDGTLYAAVKTSYDKSGYPKIALLVRRPDGTWDNMYSVSNGGTRPIVVLNEAAGRLIVAYTSSEGGGDIRYRESPLGNIAFGPQQTLISGSVNNVTSTKHTSTNEIVFLASSKGALFRFDAAPPATNQAPVVSAGPDLSIEFGESAALDGTVSDDGLPAPGAISSLWTMVGGPGNVEFADSGAIDTSASFSVDGTYVLRLTASDGEQITADEMTVTVTPPPVLNQAPVVDAGPDQSVAFGISVSLDGTVSDDGMPANAALAALWTKQSGPGTVAFANDAAIDTMADFSVAGTYVLRLMADDGDLSAFDEITINVAEPVAIVKRVRASNGTIYELDSEHWLRVNGTRVWGNTHDFALDSSGSVYWHSTGGTLARRLSNGTWETLDQNVTKFVVSNSGNAYSLATDGWLALNGSDRWANTKDFAVAADEAVYWLNTSNNLYFRPNGGSWTFIDQNVTKFAVSQDGAAYALRADGWLTVRGKNTWERTHDFILTDDQTLYWHNLDRSLYKKPSGGSWQLLGQVLQLAIRQDGLEHLLTSDGSVRVGGVVQHTGVSQLALDEFGRLVLEGFDNSSQLVAGQFMLSRRFV